MASEIRVDKINSLSGVGTVTLSPTGVDISGITTAATLRATTGIVTSLTAVSSAKVGSGVTLSPDGDIFATGVTTATTFSGSGASLTNLPAANLTGTLPAISGANLTNLDASDLASGTVPTARLGSGTASSSTFLRGDSTFATPTTTTINNNANNRVITGSGSANTLEGEQRLTYDGNGIFNITGTGAAGVFVITPDTVDGGIYFNDGSSNKGALTYLHSNETMNFRVNGTNKLTINSSGNLVLNSGSGIDFSATSDGSSATGVSELLDDYEEGVFIVTLANSLAATGTQKRLSYTKIGNKVHISGQFQVTTGGSDLIVNNLPFLTKSTGGTDETFSTSIVKTTNVTKPTDGGASGEIMAVVLKNDTNMSFVYTRTGNDPNSHTATTNGYYAVSLWYTV